MKARGMTYTPGNVRSAFEATGIWPLNERRVLDRGRSETRKAVHTPSRLHRVIPATPCHGRAILIHGRRTMNALPRQTPESKYRFELVQKLYKAAAKATAENVILTVENENLRRKASSAEDRKKTRSRKELSKAQVISAADVARIREEQEGRERAAAERRARAAAKQAQAPTRKLPNASPKKATPASSTNIRRSNKKRSTGRRVAIQASPIYIESSDSEWHEVATDWEEGSSEGGYDGLEDTIVVQPPPRALRSTSRGQVLDV